MEKKGDKSTSDPNDDSLLVPMSDAMTKSANEMKHSTCEDRGYGDIGSIDDSPLLDALVNTQIHDPIRNTIKGNVGEGAQSPTDQDNQDKTMGTHLAESIQSLNVSTSKKRKALALQNEEADDFLPKKRKFWMRLTKAFFKLVLGTGAMWGP
ncbi:hypothetical protein V6N12_002999 [Hibiscus sabdariffa]|uniref:Uncharacterized protein n=1 Tax=Hibiscus sabdariffa TaxID=183260 RepID=A0ABR2EB18_9ROSI